MADEKKKSTLADDTVDAAKAVGKVVVEGTGEAIKLGIKSVGAIGKGLGKGISKLKEKRKKE